MIVMTKEENNPHDVKVGEIAFLDKRTKVHVISFSPNEMFAMICEYANNESWSVMTDRLTPIK